MSSQQTAKKAAEFLAKQDPLVRVPTKKEKTNLLIAFAQKNKVIYGNAFDVVRLGKNIDLNDIESVIDNIQHITLLEVKSTRKENIDENFSGYFFGLTTAELLVAQNLGDRYRFIFVNTVTGHTLELKLNEIFAKAKGIYPQWSISF
jgi:hypothetical protein